MGHYGTYAIQWWGMSPSLQMSMPVTSKWVWKLRKKTRRKRTQNTRDHFHSEDLKNTHFGKCWLMLLQFLCQIFGFSIWLESWVPIFWEQVPKNRGRISKKSENCFRLFSSRKRKTYKERERVGQKENRRRARVFLIFLSFLCLEDNRGLRVLSGFLFFVQVGKKRDAYEHEYV